MAASYSKSRRYAGIIPLSRSTSELPGENWLASKPTGADPVGSYPRRICVSNQHAEGILSLFLRHLVPRNTPQPDLRVDEQTTVTEASRQSCTVEPRVRAVRADCRGIPVSASNVSEHLWPKAAPTPVTSRCPVSAAANSPLSSSASCSSDSNRGLPAGRDSIGNLLSLAAGSPEQGEGQ